MTGARFPATSYAFACRWLCSLWLALLCTVPPVAAEPAKPVIEIYVSPGCPHCAEALEFLHQLSHEQADLQLSVFDIQHDAEALSRLKQLSRQAGIPQAGVPSLWVGQQLIVGFDNATTTGARIRAALAGSTLQAGADERASCPLSDETMCRPDDENSILIPLLDQKVSIESIGLPLFTIVIGLLDGLNPCSMWVLILMISLLAPLGDQRRMLAIAGTFVAIEGVAYFAFMAAWLNLFLLIGLSRTSEIIIAVFAIVAGCLNLKDFVAFGRGPTLSIPAAAKPGIYARLRTILQTERLWPALLGTALLALLVQLVELLCTSGFPALYTRLLTLRQLDTPSYYGYLLLYNLMYMLDDVVVLGIGVLTLSQRRMQEKEGRLLKLLAGLVMLSLGLYLLLPGSR